MSSSDVAKAFSHLHAEAMRSFEPVAETVSAVASTPHVQNESIPRTANECITWIIKSWKEKDFFRLLGLPEVEVDALGRPSWECTDHDISRAYRKLSVIVHPDKMGNADHPGAREAFEHLNEAHRLLKVPGKRADEMAKRLDDAKRRRDVRDASATFSERVELNAARSKEVAQLHRAEAAEVQGIVQLQAKRRREAAQKKKQLREAALQRRAVTKGCNSDGNDGDAGANEASRKSSEDDDDDTGRRLARMNRKRQRRGAAS